MQPILAADGMPLWDTFETSLFLLAGIALGMVLGFLFPSLWRGFRRHVGRALHKDAAPLSSTDLEHVPLAPPWLVEAPEGAAEPAVGATAPGAGPTLESPRAAPGAPDLDQETPREGLTGLAGLAGLSQPLSAPGDGRSLAPWTVPDREGAFDIEAAFLRARAYGHAGAWRPAVSSLTAILRSPQASSQDMTRVYLELAQVYGHLGLLDRALALAREYQQRRPKSPRALEVLVGLARKAHSIPETLAAARNFKGNVRSPATRDLLMSVAHDLCHFCEDLLSFDRFPLAPLEPVQIRDLDACMAQAERAAPQSLRLRHVRSLRSLREAVVQAAARPDDLWVSFFAELTRLAAVSLTSPELTWPATPALVAILDRLVALPEAGATAVAAARRLATREALKDANWREVSLQKDWLAQLVLLTWCSRWPAPEDSPAPVNATHRRVAEEAFPGQTAVLGNLPSLLPVPAMGTHGLGDSPAFKMSCLAAVRVGITAHHCRSCGLKSLGFAWTCLSCGSLESMRPQFTPHLRSPS